MISDSTFTFLKYAGSCIAAFYGVYATLTDFKVEKNGKKRLSKRGYIGIALLLTSSILALSTGALQDIREARETRARAREQAENRKADLQRIETIISDLKTVGHNLEGQSTKIQETQNSLQSTSEVTNAISSNLNHAALTLLQTSNQANDILRESTQNVTHIDVTMELKLAPRLLASLKDDSGRALFSEQQLKDLEENDEDVNEQAADSLRLNSSARDTVIRKISLWTYLSKPETESQLSGSFASLLEDFFKEFAGIKQVDLFSGSDGVTRFFITPESMFGEKGISCLVTYRLNPNRFSGIRKYADLNGLTWGVNLRIDPNVAEPKWIWLDVGQTKFVLDQENFILLTVEDTNKAPKKSVVGNLLGGSADGQFEGRIRIPNSFFK